MMKYSNYNWFDLIFGYYEGKLAKMIIFYHPAMDYLTQYVPVNRTNVSFGQLLQSQLQDWPSYSEERG